jgi:hypothetical protein
MQNPAIKKLLSASWNKDLCTELVFPAIQETELPRCLEFSSAIGYLLPEIIDISSSGWISRAMS